jgi:hypothetical protein
MSLPSGYVGCFVQLPDGTKTPISLKEALRRQRQQKRWRKKSQKRKTK